MEVQVLSPAPYKNISDFFWDIFIFVWRGLERERGRGNGSFPVVEAGEAVGTARFQNTAKRVVKFLSPAHEQKHQKELVDTSSFW
jgi:hypothetical protein